MKSYNTVCICCIFVLICVFCVETDLSHSETRLSVYLDNFELHVYNQTAVYSALEKLFGIDELLPRPSESEQELVTSFLGSCYQMSLRECITCLVLHRSWDKWTSTVELYVCCMYMFVPCLLLVSVASSDLLSFAHICWVGLGDVLSCFHIAFYLAFSVLVFCCSLWTVTNGLTSRNNGSGVILFLLLRLKWLR